MKSLWNKILIHLGYLSYCCGAKTTYEIGYDRNFCTKCYKTT